MTRKTTMIAGAAIAAMAAGAGASAPAAAEPIPHAASYADLLEPVPDAMTRLQVADAQHAAGFQEAQYYGDRDRRDYRDRDRRDYRGRDHHHHHNYRDRRWYQSHGYSYYGGRWQIRPRHHHHHHHHHNNYY